MVYTNCLNHLNSQKISSQLVRQLKDEIQALQESGSYVGEVVK